MASYYDDYDNELYNPDDGHDSKTPGENANWKAIQRGFKLVEEDIASLDERLTTAEGTVAVLSERVSDVEGGLSDLANIVTGIDGRLSTAEGAITTLRTDVDAVTERVTTAEGLITQLRTDVNNIGTALDNLTDRVLSDEQTINSNTSRIAEAESYINSLRLTVNSLDSRVSTLETDVAVIKTEQTQQNSRLTSLENNMAQFLAAINNLDSRVTRAENDVDAVESDLNTFKGIAVQHSTDAPNTKIDYNGSNNGGYNHGGALKAYDESNYPLYVESNQNGVFINGGNDEAGWDEFSVTYLEEDAGIYQLKKTFRDGRSFTLDLTAVKTAIQPKTIKQGTYMFTGSDGVSGNSFSRFDVSVSISGLEARPYVFIARVIEPPTPTADSRNLVFTILNPANTFTPSTATINLPISIMFQNLGANPVSLYNPRYSVNVIAIPV